MGKYTKQQIWDIIQWVLIVLLLIACVYIGKENYDLSNSLEFKMGNTYTRIYDSQKIESLKAENKALYDSIKHLKNVESVVEVRYKYYYNTDTVFVNNSDTTKKDNIYHYTSNSDTISYNLDISANQVHWHKLDFTLNNKFLIVTKEKDGKVQTDINTDMGIIEGTTMWHRKNKSFKDRFVIGPQVGGGYDFLNKKPTLYVGFGVTYDLW